MAKLTDIAFFKLVGNKNRLILSKIVTDNGEETARNEFVIFAPLRSETFSSEKEARQRFSNLVSAILTNGEEYILNH